MGVPGSRNVGKLIRDLQRRKARERRGYVVAEGLRLVEDALAGGASVAALLVAEDAARAAAADLIARADASGVPVEIAPRRDFDAMADTETPTGVLAAVAWSPLGLEELPAPPARAVALVMDGVQDPGNVGTMIRTAHALGAWCTVALDGTADVRSPKVVRGAMGAHFRHPIAESAFDDFTRFAERHSLATCLASQDGESLPGSKLPAGRAALVVGSEGHGLREAWARIRHRRLKIPMRAGAESLNAAVAAGILLYELTRDRA